MIMMIAVCDINRWPDINHSVGWNNPYCSITNACYCTYDILNLTQNIKYQDQSVGS